MDRLIIDLDKGTKFRIYNKEVQSETMSRIKYKKVEYDLFIYKGQSFFISIRQKNKYLEKELWEKALKILAKEDLNGQ